MSPEIAPHYPNKPISPAEVLSTKAESFPEEVYIAVNGLITECMQGQYAKFTVKALTKRMEELGLNGKEIRERNWHQVGAVYEQAGWEVHYHYPDSEATRGFDPYYTFYTKGPRSW